MTLVHTASSEHVVAVCMEVFISGLVILLLCPKYGTTDGASLVEHSDRVSSFEFFPRILQDTRYELLEGNSRKSPLLERVLVSDLPDISRLDTLYSDLLAPALPVLWPYSPPLLRSSVFPESTGTPVMSLLRWRQDKIESSLANPLVEN